MIRYKGALHPGAHEPLIEPAVFDQVQSLLKARNAKMTRRVQHTHHLKRTPALRKLRVADAARLRNQPTRHHLRLLHLLRPRHEEDQLHPPRVVPVKVAERLVADPYANITISEADYRHLAANRTRLEAESDKLLAAHFADAIDLPTLKRHQDHIRAGLADIEQRLSEHNEQPQQVDDLVARYREGATLVELASAFCIHRRTVAEHLARHDVPTRRGGVDPSRIHEAAELNANG